MCVHLRFQPCLSGDKSQLYELFEEWVKGSEEWRKSQLYARITNSHGTIEADASDWLTRAELVAKLGETAADLMIAHLEANCPEKCRDHPDAPGIKDHSATVRDISLDLSNI